jgi:hypothetical protein
MDLSIVISAAVGLVSGAIGSLVAPWINWRIEKVRLKTEYQRKRIEEWRAAIEQANSFEDIRYTSAFAEIRQHMNKADLDRLFTVWISTGDINTEKLKLSKLLEVVNEVEKKWKLI